VICPMVHTNDGEVGLWKVKVQLSMEMNLKQGCNP
jgi:hypothetical protein